MTRQQGFTLVEMLVVLAVLAVLLTLALPDTGSAVVRAQIQDSLKLIENYRPLVSARYASSGTFPRDNAAAGIPPADKIIGNFVTEVVLDNGAFHLRLGNKIRPALAGRWLSVRPIYVEDSLQSPVSWICGNDSIPAGMRAAGSNQTDLAAKYLPLSCR